MKGKGGCDVRERDCHVVYNSVPLLIGGAEESHGICSGIASIRSNAIPMQAGRIAAL